MLQNKILLKAIASLLVITGQFIASKAYAICPVCTIAVGGALVLLEKYGVDNTISGLWFGGLAVSMSFWTINWLKKKKYYSVVTGILVFVFFYASIIIPLYLQGTIGIPTKAIWGIDKIVLGIGIGSIFFYLGHLLYGLIKEKNGGKAWFPFQKVAMPILPLIILTIVFYFLTK